MARIQFTANLRKHVETPVLQADGDTIGEVLRAAFEDAVQLGTYVLDEQGRLRKHVTICIDNEMIRDRAGLSDPVRAGSDIFVMQALSGG